jgi:hypothetical protein
MPPCLYWPAGPGLFARLLRLTNCGLNGPARTRRPGMSKKIAFSFPPSRPSSKEKLKKKNYFIEGLKL